MATLKQETPVCCSHRTRSWHQEPLYRILVILAGLLALHFGLLSLGSDLLTPVFGRFGVYLAKTWWAVGLGFLIGGLVEIFVPEKTMVRFLGKGRRSIFTAVGLGLLASACSHGILAIAVSLYQKGASTASVLAFLLAAPWANLAITFLLFSLFGAKALLIIGGALLVAITSGFIFSFLENRGMIEGGKEIKPNGAGERPALTLTSTVRKLVVNAWALTKSVGWWLLFGYLLASVLGTFLPEGLMSRYFGPGLLGLSATLVLASAIEICSEGSAPLAFEVYSRIKAFGNAFVFLQAGVVTDFTEIGLIWTNIGKKAALALALVGVPQIIVLGYLLNKFV